jgi:NAD/NADP transhydrogenase beta subunit
MNSRNNHLNDRVLIYAILWCLSYVGSLFAIKSLQIPIEASVILTFISVLAFALFIYKFFRSIVFMDEVQIKIQMEAVVLAFALGLLLVMTLGLIDLFIVLNPEDWSYRFLVPIFIAFYFIGLFIAKRKYNFEDEKFN